MEPEPGGARADGMQRTDPGPAGRESRAGRIPSRDLTAPETVLTLAGGWRTRIRRFGAAQPPVLPSQEMTQADPACGEPVPRPWL
jgi:hypothetical protein